MKHLSPPLEVIEENLFGLSQALLLQLARAPDTVPPSQRESVQGQPRYAETIEALRQDTPVEIAADAPAMPDWLKETIAQRCRAQTEEYPSRPIPGQIRVIEQVIGPDGLLDWDLPRPLAVCLDGPYPGRTDIWYGWMVSPETDYAGYWDVLLEESDGPCDPLAGMIQLWNPAYCYLPSTGRVLAQLSPARLAAVRAVAAEFLSGEAPAIAYRPGYIAVRETMNQHHVTTGTPLGDESDPRWRYRTLYQAALAALREPVSLALDAAREKARQPGLLDRLRTQLDQLAGLWAPGPVLAHAMGEEDSGAKLEGEIAGRLQLRAEVVDDGLITLVVRLLGEEPLRIRVIGNGQELAEHRLDIQHATEILDIDVEVNYSLRLLDDKGKAIVSIDLPAQTV
ncbi:MAG: hypothetical protein PHE55_10230 [Methylococcaceae bacterium]|nr:hypothetical protein [Methylococcaceae bacterium]